MEFVHGVDVQSGIGLRRAFPSHRKTGLTPQSYDQKEGVSDHGHTVAVGLYIPGLLAACLRAFWDGLFPDLANEVDATILWSVDIFV